MDSTPSAGQADVEIDVEATQSVREAVEDR